MHDSKTGRRTRRGFRINEGKLKDGTASFFRISAIIETENVMKTMTYLPEPEIAKTSWSQYCWETESQALPHTLLLATESSQFTLSGHRQARNKS